jgi:hypothetical protein
MRSGKRGAARSWSAIHQRAGGGIDSTSLMPVTGAVSSLSEAGGASRHGANRSGAEERSPPAAQQLGAHRAVAAGGLQQHFLAGTTLRHTARAGAPASTIATSRRSATDRRMAGTVSEPAPIVKHPTRPSAA